MDDFQAAVIDRLARIETKQDAQAGLLAQHLSLTDDVSALKSGQRALKKGLWITFTAFLTAAFTAAAAYIKGA
jgi:hypothetical protein